MENISLFPQNYKKTNTYYLQISHEEYLQLRSARLISGKLHFQRLILNYREIQVKCPIIVADISNPIIVMPAFKFPYRPYPIFVYFYAIALYLTGISMRKAAMKTAQKFGIPSFSHSTISRVFSRMAANIDLLQSLLYANQYDEKSLLKTALPGLPKCKTSPKLKSIKKAASPVLAYIFSPILDIQFKESLLPYERFMKYCCLLI